MNEEREFDKLYYDLLKCKNGNVLISSEIIRNSDGENNDFGSFKESLSKTNKTLLNEQLEKNYQRGFQQSLASVERVMEHLNINSLTREDIHNLQTLSGQMRDYCKKDKDMSFYHYGNLFIHNAIKFIK